MYIRVHVTPDSKREALEKLAPDTWQISVREPAAGNRANDRVRELIARALSLEPRAVRILTGHRTRSKLVSVDDSTTN